MRLTELETKTNEFESGTKKEKITKFLTACLSNDATIPACKIVLEIGSNVLNTLVK